MTLADFLLARIAEDEAFGRTKHPDPIVRDYAARVLAECESKRRIVTELGSTSWPTADGGVHTPLVSRLLALPYADHPDYRDEWRP